MELLTPCFATAAPVVARQRHGTTVGRCKSRLCRPRSRTFGPTCEVERWMDGAAGPSIPRPRAVTSAVEIAPGKVVSFETGRVARQAAGSIVVRQGDTLVFCTACSAVEPEPGADFLPLRVDYAEKFSAAGRTPGSYVKREGRASEHETLCSRLIDRALRPLFAGGYFNEVQLLANVMSYDGVHPGDALAICGCAAALHVSEIPLVKSVAGVRVALVNDEFIVNPTAQEMRESGTSFVVAGTRDAILMIEGSCDVVSEGKVLEGVAVAQSAIAKLCDCMDELRKKVGRQKVAVEPLTFPPELMEQIASVAVGLDDAIAIPEKQERGVAMGRVKNAVFNALAPSRADKLDDPQKAAEDERLLTLAYKKLVSRRIRGRIFDSGVRSDGRGLTAVRPITIDQSPLPCAHGSSLFTRGETQALAVATLGDESMAQRFETLDGEDASRFYLQYSFPPSSVGEVGRIGAPGRREVGHGKLAERALAAVLPPRQVFPYVIRVESTITESCGSSSMASVCGGCLALLDAGVPLRELVAGIAMGLMLDAGSEGFVVLTDILGLEDALGDMDFKVAGTSEGITALQMDIKVEGVSVDIMRQALEQARVGRLHILNEMRKVQSVPRDTLPRSLPKLRTLSIPVSRIGDVIGPGGRKIKSVIEQCGGDGEMNISIGDDGIVSFASSNEAMIQRAVDLVKSMATTVDVGMRVEGVVTKVLPFGAYVSIGSGREGWLHISELEAKRTNSVEDVLSVGDKCMVEVIEVGRNGQCRLSRKACLASSNKNPVSLDGQ